ncbi:25018_t:CDS:1, partial [Gigaspora rosea]
MAELGPFRVQIRKRNINRIVQKEPTNDEYSFLTHFIFSSNGK